ncbi:MAG: hypothetical protein ACREGR_01830 [Minisyncoccia bacterium]
MMSDAGYPDPKLAFTGGSIEILRGNTKLSLRISLDGQPPFEVPVHAGTLEDFIKKVDSHVCDFKSDMNLIAGLFV